MEKKCRGFLIFVGVWLGVVGVPWKEADACLPKQMSLLRKEAKALPLEQRGFAIVRGLVSRCKKLPPFLAMYLEGHPAYDGPFGTSRLDWRKEFPRSWARACPGSPSKNPFEHPKNAQAELELYDRCGGEGKKYITREELREKSETYPSFASGAILYKWLLDAGVDASDARSFVREAYFEGFAKERYAPPLLSSGTQHPLEPMTLVQIDLRNVLVDRLKVCDLFDGRIDPAFKKDSIASSYLILPFYEKLKEAAFRQTKLSAYNPALKFLGRYAMRFHPKTPFRLISEVMYTAGQAGFGQPFLVVEKKRSTAFSGGPGLLPISVPDLPQGEPLGQKDDKPVSAGTIVSLTEDGIKVIVRGKRLPQGCKMDQFAQENRAYRLQDGTYRFSESRKVALPDIDLSRLNELMRKADLPTPVRTPTPALQPQGPTFPTSKVSSGQGGQDLAGLHQCLAGIKKLVPYDEKITFMAEPQIPFQTLLEAIEASRKKDRQLLFSRILFAAGIF